MRVRNNATWDDRIVIDVEYVNNITFIKDVKIIFETVFKVFKCESIYKEKTEKKEKVNV